LALTSQGPGELHFGLQQRAKRHRESVLGRSLIARRVDTWVIVKGVWRRR
jgi:hypothetical protein